MSETVRGGANVLKPARLQAGDAVSLVAPASPWENRSELLRAVAGLEAWGPKVKLGDHVNDRHGYPAGRDEDRAADLNAAFADPETRRSSACRGLRQLAPHPVARPRRDRREPQGLVRLLGHHLAAPGARGLEQHVSFYSNGAAGVGDAETTAFSRDTMRRALFSDEPYGEIPDKPDDPYVRTITGGTAKGRLTAVPDPGAGDHRHADRDRHDRPDPLLRGPGHAHLHAGHDPHAPA